MTYRPRRTIFLQQLTNIARRARRWAMAIAPRAPQYQAVTRHKGRAY